MECVRAVRGIDVVVVLLDVVVASFAGLSFYLAARR